jgi:hypothetical protein
MIGASTLTLRTESANNVQQETHKERKENGRKGTKISKGMENKK